MVDLFMPDLSVVMPKTALEVRASGGFLFFCIYCIFYVVFEGIYKEIVHRLDKFYRSAILVSVTVVSLL